MTFRVRVSNFIKKDRAQTLKLTAGVQFFTSNIGLEICFCIRICLKQLVTAKEY